MTGQRNFGQPGAQSPDFIGNLHDYEGPAYPGFGMDYAAESGISGGKSYSWLMIGQPSIPGTGMNRIIGAGHSEYEWTIWSECKEGTQQRERLKQGGKSGKDFETKLCSKGFPTPKPPYTGFGVSGAPI